MDKNDSSIRLYLFENIENFEQNLNEAIQSLDEDAVHDFRVALKKLRAIFIFLGKTEISDVSFSNQVKKFKKVFKAAGIVRDRQVHKNLIANYEEILSADFNVYKLFIDQQISSSGDDFILVAKKALLKLNVDFWNEILMKVQSIDESEVLQGALKFIRERMEKVRRILAEESQDYYQLHFVRKVVKQVRYIYEMRMSFDWNTPEHQTHLEELKTIETILGTWHDQITLLNDLEKHMVLLSQSNNKKTGQLNILAQLIRKDIEEGLQPLKSGYLKEYNWFKGLK